MARSINFNETDMSAYELIVTTPGFNLLRQLVSRVQLQDRGYAFRPMRQPRVITADFSVTGTSLANLDVNLDAVKRLLTLTEPKKLIFDSLPLRYYNAILESFEGEYRLATLFQGILVFVCPDPLGYKTTESDHSHDINLSPKTINEPVGGTGYVAPVLTLTATNTLTGATIKVKNLTTDEELQWIGDLAIDGTLVIDVAKWLVSKGAVASMATVTGKFPRLKPNVTNQIKVTGLQTTKIAFPYTFPFTFPTQPPGNLNILYRDTYL